MKILTLTLLFAALCVSGCSPSYDQAQRVLKAYPGAELSPVGFDSFYVRTPDNRVFKVYCKDGKLTETWTLFSAR